MKRQEAASSGVQPRVVKTFHRAADHDTTWPAKSVSFWTNDQTLWPLRSAWTQGGEYS